METPIVSSCSVSHTVTRQQRHVHIFEGHLVPKLSVLTSFMCRTGSLVLQDRTVFLYSRTCALGCVIKMKFKGQFFYLWFLVVFIYKLKLTIVFFIYFLFLPSQYANLIFWFLLYNVKTLFCSKKSDKILKIADKYSKNNGEKIRSIRFQIKKLWPKKLSKMSHLKRNQIFWAKSFFILYSKNKKKNNWHIGKVKIKKIQKKVIVPFNVYINTTKNHR